jgi:Ca2+-dependent lipid-binding protein
MNEYQLSLTVLRGISLPKVDLLSKIDPYVKVHCGAFTGKTKTIDNCSEPVWDHDFFFSVPIGLQGLPQGVVTLELHDSETLKVRTRTNTEGQYRKGARLHLQACGAKLQQLAVHSH